MINKLHTLHKVLRSPTRDWLLAFAVAAVAVLLAVAFVYPRQWTRGFLVNEEMYFATLAHNLADGRGYVTNAIDVFVADEIDSFPVPEFTRPPGYAVMLAVVLRLGLGDVAAGAGLSIFWLTLTMMAFYSMARHLLGSWRTALFLCGLYLASSTTLVHATMAAPEMQFDALFLLMCWCLVNPTRWRCLVAGVFLHLGTADLAP